MSADSKLKSSVKILLKILKTFCHGFGSTFWDRLCPNFEKMPKKGQKTTFSRLNRVRNLVMRFYKPHIISESLKNAWLGFAHHCSISHIIELKWPKLPVRHNYNYIQLEYSTSPPFCETGFICSLKKTLRCIDREMSIVFEQSYNAPDF